MGPTWNVQTKNTVCIVTVITVANRYCVCVCVCNGERHRRVFSRDTNWVRYWEVVVAEIVGAHAQNMYTKAQSKPKNGRRLYQRFSGIWKLVCSSVEETFFGHASCLVAYRNLMFTFRFFDTIYLDRHFC